MEVVVRIADARWIRIRDERVEWQRRDGVAVGGVEVHVLGEAVGVEEIVARPAGGKVGQMRGVEIYDDFVAGAEDDVFVVERTNELGDVAVARVVADLARVGAGEADVFVDVSEIVLRIAFDDARIAAEMRARRSASGISVERNGRSAAELSTRMRSQ